MEEIISNIQIVKAVKKVTYSGIINKAHLSINPENAPIRKFIRSHSSKKVTTFVSKLQPKKSTLIPTPLKLNLQNNITHKKKDNDDEKQLSEDEIENNGNDSFSSISSSDMNNSSDEEKENEYEKDKDKNTLCHIIEKEESDSLNNDNIDSFNLNDTEGNKNMRAARRKMSLIRAKAEKNKSKETKDIINDNLKNIYDIGLKKSEDKNENLTPKLHGSICFGDENKNINRPRTKSIFEVISNSASAKKNKKDMN